MCGVFGWHTNGVDTSDLMVCAQVLAYSNDQRGGHSWGWALPDGTVKKGLGEMHVTQEAFAIAKFPLVIAHTRWRTMGGINLDNCHPFSFGNIIGAHNGMIYNHEDINRKYSRKFDVDSMHIFQHISEGKWPLDEFEGYGTIEYFNKADPDGVYLAHHKGDLAVARLPSDAGFVWSSNETDLELALDIVGWGYHILKLKEECVYRFGPRGTLFRMRGKQKLSFQSRWSGSMYSMYPYSDYMVSGYGAYGANKSKDNGDGTKTNGHRTTYNESYFKNKSNVIAIGTRKPEEVAKEAAETHNRTSLAGPLECAFCGDKNPDSICIICEHCKKKCCGIRELSVSMHKDWAEQCLRDKECSNCHVEILNRCKACCLCLTCCICEPDDRPWFADQFNPNSDKEACMSCKKPTFLDNLCYLESACFGCCSCDPRELAATDLGYGG